MFRPLFGCNWGQVDETLHRWQWFNLASCPASLPLPQAARGADAEPAIAASFANDPFIVIDVGHASHCYDAGLQYLCECKKVAPVKTIYVYLEFFNKSWCGRHYLDLPLRWELNYCCSIDFTQQNATGAWKPIEQKALCLETQVLS